VRVAGLELALVLVTHTNLPAQQQGARLNGDPEGQGLASLCAVEPELEVFNHLVPFLSRCVNTPRIAHSLIHSRIQPIKLVVMSYVSALSAAVACLAAHPPRPACIHSCLTPPHTVAQCLAMHCTVPQQMLAQLLLLLCWLCPTPCCAPEVEASSLRIALCPNTCWHRCC
jgi:hypothetical protein